MDGMKKHKPHNPNIFMLQTLVQEHSKKLDEIQRVLDKLLADVMLIKGKVETLGKLWVPILLSLIMFIVQTVLKA